MSNLKELTWEHHKDAERQAFVKVLLSGKIHPKFYATFLWNQHKKYDLLEALAQTHGLLDGMPNIKRKLRIEEDFLELWTNEDKPPVILNATNEYIAHMKDVMHDPDSIMAHVYTYHMGDLSGGQMIAKRVPGSTKFYQFNEDVDVIKDKIRTRLDDEMADEAKICFDFATELFKQMAVSNN